MGAPRTSIFEPRHFIVSWYPDNEVKVTLLCNGRVIMHGKRPKDDVVFKKLCEYIRSNHDCVFGETETSRGSDTSVQIYETWFYIKQDLAYED